MYLGKRVEIVQDEKGYFWIVWHNENVPQSPAWTWRNERAALADAKRFIERTYGNSDRQGE